MPGYDCPLCSNFNTRQFHQLLSHIQLIHSPDSLQPQLDMQLSSSDDQLDAEGYTMHIQDSKVYSI